VIARSVHCNYPSEVAGLPSIGSGLEPDLERILSLQPTLVVATEAQAGLPAIATLRAAGVSVLLVPDITLDDVPVAIGQIGEATGHVEEATELARSFAADLTAIDAAVAGREPTRALLVVAREPIFAAGPDSRLGALLALAGAQNVLETGDWVAVDDELVVARAPQVIVDASGSGDSAWWGRLHTVPAVANGRICHVDADLLARPGPRLAEGARALARCLHTGLVVEAVPTTSLGPPSQIEIPGAVRLASWNIAWLRAGEAVAVAGRGEGNGRRTEEDLARLARYLEALDADVIVLQEVEGEVGARKVFDASWNIYFADETDPQRVGVAWRRHVPLVINDDYAALDVGGVRRGIDFTIQIDSGPIRVLGVHLKSGCFTQDWTTARAEACEKFGLQVPLVEAWIDARAAAGEAFAVVGDFNRRLNPTDEMWRELDDRDPRDLRLLQTTAGRTQQCWASHYPDYIDHIVLGGEAIAWLRPDSFTELVYQEPVEMRDVLSDHCPIAVTLGL
jgi:ABC-type hemin transport system substrate-binding protein/endonuclease/exonuclease/phosphatase family metal-dependent hydrolase